MVLYLFEPIPPPPTIMADSPRVSAPLDPKELPILNKLLSIRDKLELLKQDKTKYVKSQDVVPLYNDIIEQVELLNSIHVGKRNEQNRGMKAANVW